MWHGMAGRVPRSGFFRPDLMILDDLLDLCFAAPMAGHALS